MARPIKSGVDYFPLDTVLDTKFELIEAEFGLTGFAVVVKLFQKIYGGQGYYCEWTDEVALLFSKKIGGGNAVSEIVSAAIKRGIFNKEMYEKYSILTSKGIQERYFEAVSRRVQVNVKKEYLLVSDTLLSENVNNNEVSADRNPENVYRNTQSKEKESKVNKNKGEESINASPGKKPTFTAPGLENCVSLPMKRTKLDCKPKPEEKEDDEDYFKKLYGLSGNDSYSASFLKRYGSKAKED